jgi:uncharacterized protein (TIGR00255 family)
MAGKIRSMTGFGRAFVENDALSASCEIKALNGRYFEADIRLPRYFNEVDPMLRRLLGEKLERGTISCSYNIKFKTEGGAAQSIVVNQEAAKNYLAILTDLSQNLGVEIHDVFREVIKSPEVITYAEREISDDIKKQIVDLTILAAENLNGFRETEGAATGQKLLELVQSISTDLIQIEHHEDDRRENLRERVYGNVIEHVKEHVLDENRLEQEVLIYLDKWDIAEEKQRLSQHVTYFIQTLNTDPNGRKLNFISQEMGREMNTMGVKSNYFPMQQLVV